MERKFYKKAILFLIALGFITTLHAQKIALTSSMITQENGSGSAYALVDEQAESGDPLAGSGNSVDSQWEPGWSSSVYYAYINLGQPYNVTNISLFDANASGNVVVSTGIPNSWTPLFTDNMDGYDSWSIHSVNVNTQYIRLAIPRGVGLNEIIIYGSAQSAISVSGITLSATTISIDESTTSQLSAVVSPSNATDKSVNWSSSNASVATVNSSGLVTAIAAGTAIITATTVDQAQTAMCNVTVTDPVVSVSDVSISSITSSIEVSSSTQLSATVSPSNATNKSVNWSSSNTSIATVNSNGLVTAISAGTTIITVTTVDQAQTATCNVTVTAPITIVNVNSVSLNPTMAAINTGSSTQLSATVSPANASNKSVIWSSSNTAIASVSSTGIVSANSVGTATITATTVDQSKTATSTITVNASQTGSSSKIALTTSMITQENGDGNATALINEQSICDPRDGNAGSPSTKWEPGWSASIYYAYIDLGCISNITEIYLFDGNSSGNVVISAGSPDNWTELFTDDMTGYFSWQEHSVSVSTQYIRIALPKSVGLNEIVIYGSVGSAVNVTGVSMSSTIASVAAGSTTQLETIITPSNATNQTVTWVSSDTNIATISSTGLVTAISDGTATITATTVDQSLTTSCLVTVTYSNIVVSDITLNTSNISLNAGSASQLNAYITPTNATNQSVNWHSSNTSVATVNSTGLVTALAEGTATITVTTADQSKTATCAISVSSSNIAVTDVTLNTSNFSLDKGSVSQLNATITPTNAINQSVIWSSSNTSIATVNATGIVTAIKEGTTTITVTTSDQAKTASCVVTVVLASNFNGKIANITELTTAPVIDGTVDAMWNTIESNDINNLANTGTGGSTVSASWKAVWDNTDIYFLFEVNDDVALNNGAGNDIWYIHDCIEVFTDINNTQSDTEVTNSNGQYQLRFIYGLDTEAIYENPTMNYTQSSQSTTNGYVIEVKFPWSNITPSSMGIGSSFGFDVKVTDIDITTGSNPWPSHYEFVWNNSAEKKPINFGLTNLVPTDETAPATINNLSSDVIGSTSFILNWTASGDDNLLGKANAYDIRMSTSIINEENFANTTIVSTASTPKKSGSSESLEIADLTGNSTYYFAIKAIDEAGNYSDISNILSVTTTPPDLTAPAAIIDLSASDISYSSLILNWTAPGDDTNSGTAISYDIRYSTSTIDATNFDNATSINNIPTPSLAGTSQSLTVNGLKTSTTYYFAIKTIDEEPNTSDISNIISPVTIATTWGNRIEITNNMVINELGLQESRGNYANLFDEQDDITSDLPSGTPTTHWRIPSAGFGSPNGIIIDLGKEYDIKQLYWYEASPYGHNGTDIEIKGGKFQIEVGLPFQWIKQFEHTMNDDNAWHSQITSFRTRFLRIVKISTDSYSWSGYGPFNADMPLMEMVIYGTPYGDPVTPPILEPHQEFNLPVDKFLGGNAWWYSDTSVNNAVGIVRTYQDWKFTKSATTTSVCDFSKTMDNWYKLTSTKSDSYEVYPCIQGDIEMKQNKPNYDGDSKNPASYALHADHMFQWAGRYGKNTSLSSDLMRVKSYETPHTGLGYINYIEDWNEQDKTWEGEDAFFLPFEYAAMASADFDGHMNTMGNTVGVKNADPSIKMVMGGLTNVDLDYVKAIKFWADYKRNGEFPADVLNFHHYSNDGGGQGGSATMGISPEADHVREHFKELVKWRNENTPGKELWVSEYGWDTKGTSWQIARGHTQYSTPGYTAIDLQAMWMVRGFLAGTASGIDRMIMYSLEDAGGGTTFLSCGLATRSGAKKKSWYYVHSMKNRLKGMSFVGEKVSGNTNVMIYKYKNQADNNGVYAVWCPTSDGTTVNNFSINFDANTNIAKLITLADQEPLGIESTLSISGNSVTVNVSENPIFIEVDNIDGVALKNAMFQNEPIIEKNQTIDSNMDIYPNPTCGSFNVLLNSNTAGTLELFDMCGRLQQKQTFESGKQKLDFDVSNLNKGVYVLRMKNGNNAKISKIIIE